MSSSKILNKLLSQTQNPLQLTGGILGTFTGILLILVATQIYFEYLNLTASSINQFGKEYIIINKKVTGLNTISGNVSTFRDSDISKIKKLSSVRHIGYFTVNKFSIFAELSMGGRPTGIKTELFFEAVDDRFLDVIPEKWGWKPQQEFIPMLLPADYINLYNFTFAPARGLPLISPNTIKLASFRLKLTGDKGYQNYIGKVVGYSQRLNSILVPKSFIEYSNAELTDNIEAEKKSRIIIEVDQGKTPEIVKLIKENNWETNESKMMSSKFALLLEMILLVIIALGILTLFVAFFSTILYLLLTMNRAKYEIQTLLVLGVPSQHIINWYARGIAKIYIFIAAASTTLTLYLKAIVADYISKFGFKLLPGLHPITIISAFIAIICLWLLQYLRIRKLT
jgi:hypothetical protein